MEKVTIQDLQQALEALVDIPENPPRDPRPFLGLTPTYPRDRNRGDFLFEGFTTIESLWYTPPTQLREPIIMPMPCVKCGSRDIQATTAEEVGGMPGLECVRYEKCMACGYVTTVRVNLKLQEPHRLPSFDGHVSAPRNKNQHPLDRNPTY
jgi:hypothetical protein